MIPIVEARITDYQWLLQNIAKLVAAQIPFCTRYKNEQVYIDVLSKYEESAIRVIGGG